MMDTETTNVLRPELRSTKLPRETARAVAATSRLRAARLLSAMIVVLMVVRSTAGLWMHGLYQDPASVEALFRGYDLVALVVAAPVLAVTLVPVLRGSPRAQLVWASMLAYSLYTYASYVFGAAFNDFFLVHVALFSLSLFALVLALANLDVAGIGARFREHTPARWISGFLLFLAVPLGGMWVFYSLRFAATGEFPAESRLVLPTTSMHLAYVLDLSLLIPGYALAAVLLWRRAAWGYLLDWRNGRQSRERRDVDARASVRLTCRKRLHTSVADWVADTLEEKR